MNSTRPLFIVSLLTAVLLLAAAMTAGAATFLVPTDRQLVDRSDAIVTGTVTGSSSRMLAGGKVVTDYRIRVDEALKGAAAAEVVVTEFGGSVPGRIMVIEGSANYQPGQRVMAFLRARPDGTLFTTSMTLGAFVFSRDTAGDSVLVSDADDVVPGERPRLARQFTQFVRDVVRGAAADEQYESPLHAATAIHPPVASDGNAKNYALTGGSPVHPLRWEKDPGGGQCAPPNSCTLQFLVNGTIAGVNTSGGINSALNAWTNDPNAVINLTNGGSTTISSYAFDNKNTILLGDSEAVTNGLCDGTIGCTVGWSTGTIHTFDGDSYYNINDADIIIRPGSYTQALFDTLMTHELGHSIGIRHSDQGTPSSSNAVMTATFNATLGANLQQWDKDAVDSLYGNGVACTPVSITAQSQSQTVVSGSNATLFVTAGGTPTFAYQWYNGDSGNTSAPVAGATGSNFNTPPVTTTTKYWVRVMNLCGSADSATIVLTPSACTKPAITVDPQSQTILTGTSATLNVGHNGTSPFTYQWYIGTSGNTTTPVGGATSITFNTGPLTTTTSFWVRVTNSCGSADSATAVITVSQTCTPPSFNRQPLSFAVPSGTNTTLTASAGAGTTYQWYQGTAPDTSTPLASLVPSNSTYVQRIYLDLLGRPADAFGLATFTSQLDSNAATKQQVALTLLGSNEYKTRLINGFYATYLQRIPSAIESPFVNMLMTLGDENVQAILTSSPEYYIRFGGGTNNGWITRLYNDFLGRNPSAFDIATWNTALGSASRQQVALTIIRSGESRSRFVSQLYNRFLNRTPGAGEISGYLPGLTTGNTSDEQVIAVIVGSEEYSAVGSVLITGPVTTATNFWVKATNACGSANSTTATISIAPCTPVIQNQPANTAIFTGTSPTFTVAVTGVGPFGYQWYAGTTGDTSRPINGATEPSLTAAPIPAVGTYSFWVRITNACGSADSNAAVATVACGTPPKPVVMAPPSIMSRNSYRVAWDSVSVITAQYVLQESKTPDFASPTVYNPTSNFVIIPAHNEVTSDTRFYYRVQALSSCGGTSSPFSDTASTLVSPTPPSRSTVFNFFGQAGQNSAITGSLNIGGFGSSGKTGSSAADTFTITSDQPWLTVNPSSGSLPAEGLDVAMSIDPTQVPVGASVANLTITRNQAGSGKTALGSSSTTVPVNISVVTPVSPVAKDPNAPSDTLLIPAVAHADGAGGSHFQSDVRITNTGDKLMNYQLTFTPSGPNGAANSKQTTLSINPNETKALNDLVKVWYSSGVAGDTSAVGTLEIRPTTPSIGTTTVASSRTYNVASNGTFGQFIPALNLSTFLGKSSTAKISLQQLASSLAYRTNLGFVEAAGQNVSMLLQLFDGKGASVKSVPMTLAPFEHRQTGLTAIFGPDVSLADARLEVTVTSDAGRVTSYGSVLDNVSTDPFLVLPVQPASVSSSRYVVPGVAELNNGAANFHTNMRIYNGGADPVTATLNYYPSTGSSPAPQAVTIAPGEVKSIDNTLLTLWNITGSGGSVLVTTPANSSLVVTANTFSRRSDGATFGQFIPAVSPTDAVGLGDRTLHVLQLEQSAAFRSNVGFVETSGNPVTLEITGITPDSKAAAKISLDLAPNQFMQLNAILAQMGFTNVYNGRVTVRVTAGSGRVSAYGSIIDNLTQDPTYVPAQ